MAQNPDTTGISTDWTCHVCGLCLSRKQRLQSHMRSKHPDARPLDHLQYSRGAYKLYDLDDAVPVPKRTKIRHKSSAFIAHDGPEGLILPVVEKSEQSEMCLDESNKSTFDSASQEIEEHVSEVGPSQEKCMAVLSYITKMRLTGTASEQLVRLLRLFGSTDVSSSQVRDSLNGNETKMFDYCEKCSRLFNEEDIFQCATHGCDGLRYSGPEHSQNMKKPKCYFATTSVGAQVTEVLARSKDIANQITLTMNTDGVPLYNSSSVSLWPVFLVINELPPSERFLIQNMIIWGLWQGCGKPVFKSFFQPLVTELNHLHRDGLLINGENVTVTLSCVTMDLQAKAQVMEMVPHNGQFPCVTCEIPGKVVKKGKGHTKCFPIEDPSPSRTSASILHNAEEAIHGRHKHVKGVKSVSVLFDVDHFNPVDGIVPDYMHGVLLGTTKKLLSLWFSSSSSKEPYYIGNRVREVDAMLLGMKPTDNVSRLPRGIEGHLCHWKASEFQHWLLFYSIPCLQDILPATYLSNLCFLVEGIYILLGDNITSVDIENAELALAKFQISFETLYGISNCGLNVHNIGCHLANYAKQHGPLWAWSCFAFEDMNGILLKSAHGTGDVCRQLLTTLLAQKKLHSEVNQIKDTDLKEFTLDMLSTGRKTKSSKECQNCRLLGKCVNCEDENLSEQLTNILGTQCSIKKVSRIKLNGQVISSKSYKRMQRRNCNTVLLSNGSINMVNFYLYDEYSNMCFAHVKEMEVLGFANDKVSHLIRVAEKDKIGIVPVQEIIEKVMYLDGNKDMICVVRLPNFYSHCV